MAGSKRRSPIYSGYALRQSDGNPWTIIAVSQSDLLPTKRSLGLCRDAFTFGECRHLDISSSLWLRNASLLLLLQKRDFGKASTYSLIIQ